MRFHYDFFLKRKGLELSDFLKGVFSVEEAILVMENSNLFGYEVSSLAAIVDLNLSIRDKDQPSRKRKSRARKKPLASSKKAVSKPKKDSSRVKDEKKEDSSYFATWKVPYVEP